MNSEESKRDQREIEDRMDPEVWMRLHRWVREMLKILYDLGNSSVVIKFI